MKKLTFTALILKLLLAISFAQDKVIEIPMIKNEQLIETMDLGENGFITRTAVVSKTNFVQKEWTLRHYSPLLKLKWETTIPKPKRASNGYMVASKDGKYVYQIKRDYKKYGTDIMYFTLIENGKIKDSFSVVEELDHVQHVFCDDEHLYFLTTLNGREVEKSKIDEKLILHSFKHSDHSHHKKTIELPELNTKSAVTFWSYVGNNDGNIYISSKTVFTNLISFKLVKINNKGIVQSILPIDISLEKQNILPSKNTKDFARCYYKYDTDFFKYNQNNADIGAYGGITMSNNFNSFYIYGILGPKPYQYSGYKNYKNEVNGFFISKFSLSGENIYFINKELPEKIKPDVFFNSDELPISRKINLSQGINESITFQLASTKGRVKIYTLTFNKDGSLIDDDYIDYKDNRGIHKVKFDYVTRPTSESQINEFLKSIHIRKDRFKKFYYHPSSIAEVLIHFDPEAKKEKRVIKIESFYK